jgi:hypothetical protein
LTFFYSLFILIRGCPNSWAITIFGRDNMNLTETIRLSIEISEKLFFCTSESEIENTFDSFKISKIPDKIGLLQLCMGVKNYSSSPLNNLTPEQQYHDALLIFLDGSWRFLV